ncbi:MAG: stage III sporulation protein AF [Candidatus Cohnella colombiensis]|uniref:Stage III sporulation protein AF n=1 Tax=Candidatus Cohnella colombiensis TaxID=3121368 RepID=A0AA95F628_9BACL|nr:MAG: stage III sporulation protein AF [Cohnella sp.]
MDGLVGWLRQIIAVVLLASIVDLLLPNRTMQKYVRLVAGLFILLTVATPVLNWLKGDFTSEISSSLAIVEKSPESAKLQLAKIEADAQKLREKQTTRANELVSERLASSIRQEVERSEGRSVRNVEVNLQQLDDGNWDVANVNVVLESQITEPDRTSQQTGKLSTIQEVEPIAAVDVRIHVDVWPKDHDQNESENVIQSDRQTPTATVTAPTGSAVTTMTEVDNDTQQRITALIASRYGIPTRSIQVTQIAANGTSVER